MDTGKHGSKNTGIQEYMYTIIKGSRDSCIHGNTWIQEYMDPGILGSWNSWIQEYLDPGIHGSRNK